MRCIYVFVIHFNYFNYLKSVISGRDVTHSAFGSKLAMSSTYHPQTDGQSERTIQSLEDLLRTCILDHLGPWDEVLPLIEFTYNNSFHASIGMALLWQEV